MNMICSFQKNYTQTIKKLLTNKVCNPPGIVHFYALVRQGLSYKKKTCGLLCTFNPINYLTAAALPPP